jgi:cytosine deaminase
VPVDLVIRGATVPGRTAPQDVLADNGLIVAVEPSASADDRVAAANMLFQARGYLVMEGAVDGHLHLDKSLAGADWQSLPQARDWREKSRFGEQVLATLTDPPLEERIASQAQRLIDRGTVVARTHATITPARGLSGVEATLRAREHLAGALDLQVVAFPQYGTRLESMPELLAEALRLGCEVVGGNDPATYDHDIEAQLRVVFRAAVNGGTRIDIHLHDGGHLGLFEIERVCRWTISEGLQGRVAVSHALGLGDLTEEEIRPTVDLLAEADVAIIVQANPDVSMAPISLLEAAGVRVGLGSDSAHSVLPFGTGDMLKKANLVAQRSIVTSDEGLARLWERASRDTAQILGRHSAPIEVGTPATMLLVRARSVAEAVASPPADRLTIVRGRAVGSMGDGGGLVAA